MSSDLIDELQRTSPDPAMLPHAMRYFVSAQSGDLPPGRIQDALLGGGLTLEQLGEAADLLQRDPVAMESTALAVLQAGWADPGERDLVRGALGAAQAKLPVVEPGLIAIVAVYGLWLIATRGRRSHEHVIRRKPDGSYEESETTEWFGPAAPLEAIAKVLGLQVESGEDADQLPQGDDGPEPPAS
jgi:hypothetical protein